MWKKYVDVLEHEDKYGIKSKTHFFHSILSLVILTGIVSLFNQKGALFFGIAYFSHLILDWIDEDEKMFLWPLKIKFRGFLPVWSKTEQVVTVITLIALIILFL